MESSQNEKTAFHERAKALVSAMTLEEKVSQMQHCSPAIPRLGVPAYNWWCEALHGVARAGVATVFPQAIGVAATFDEALVEQMADIISTEGRAKFHEFQKKDDRGIYKGLTFWSPNVNLFRDPRWGRGQETYGEDPFLIAQLGKAFVRGIQGNDGTYLKAAACAKHFAAHSGPEGERHRFNAAVSKKDLYETYLPAFRALVMEAGVAGVMGAYNRLNGEPCCGDEKLLTGLLRKTWGFQGYVTSDCDAVNDFHGGHRVTKDAEESAALALNSGCDLECGNQFANLAQACRDGLVEEKTIDRAVSNLMEVRMRLGLFDKPEEVPYSQISYEENDSPEHRGFALEVSKRSLVLLKNENHLLPLNREKIGAIAVIGPNADSREALMGNYCGTPSGAVTVLQGIREAVPGSARVYYAQGCHLYQDREEALAEADDRLSEAVSAAEHADVAVVCLGLNAELEGEEGDAVTNQFVSGDKPDLNLPGRQQNLLEAVAATGKPVILVLLSGSALAVSWADEHLPAVVQAWYPGMQGGRAVASLLFGDYSPSGRLPVTFYRSDSDLPDFHDYSMKNRTYRYIRREALYPFGYGLSYTRFRYRDLSLSKAKLCAGESLHCAVTVKNTGEMESDEVVQLYLKDVRASVAVPNWHLEGVRVVPLKPGEERQVEFTVTPRQMALVNENGEFVLEPGVFQVFAGGGQPDSRSRKLLESGPLEASFEVMGESIKFNW